MDEQRLKKFLALNYNSVFEDIELFIEAIPHVAKMIGVSIFLQKIGLSKTQYYARLKKTSEWSISELKIVLKVFNEFNIGKL